MVAVQTAIDVGVDPTAVKIYWQAPADNSDPITEYQILIRKAGGAEYAEELTYCDGADATIAAARQCFVPLTTLRGAVFSLVYGDLVVARARARNSLGYGQYSQPNVLGATVQTEPTQMAAPTMVGTSLSFVAIAWLALAGDDTGGAAIESYHAQYALAGSGAWSDLLGQSGSYQTGLAYNLTTASAGAQYDFRVRSRNVHGWGAWSSTTTIQAAAVPGQPTAATTAFQDASVRVSWTAPSANFKTITAYGVELRDSAGNYHNLTSYCDPVSAGLVSSRYCDVPVSVLRAAPFNLGLQALVVARVRAYNVRGWGEYSPANTVGALIETEPT
jgi:hypothetical protein